MVASNFSFSMPYGEAHELKIWQQQMNLAKDLSKKGKHKESMSALIEAFKDLKGVSHARDEHKKEFVESLTKLANSYHKAGDWSGEYQVLILLGAYYRYEQKTDSVEYADCLWRTGINCDHRRAFDEGLANLKQAAEIYKDHPLISDERISRIDRGLGHLYSETNQLARAEKSLSDAEKLTRSLLNERVHDLGRALLLKGKLYKKNKNYTKSLESYRLAVSVFKDNYRRGHFWLSQALSAYCQLLNEILNSEQFEDVAEGTKTNRKIVLLSSLAQSDLLNNSYFEAKETLLRLRAFYESNKLTGRAGYAKCLDYLGECCFLLSDYKDGYNYQKEAVRLYRINKLNSSELCDGLIRLAFFQGKVNDDLTVAKTTLSNAKQLARTFYGEQSSEFGRCLHLELSWYSSQENLDGTEPILKKLSLAYPKCDIPLELKNKKELSILLHRLTLNGNNRLHRHMWYDWERLSL